jgi:hypothetical protein
VSIDNFVAIVRGKDGIYRGYDCCASLEYKTISDYRRKGSKIFEAKNAIVATAKFYEYDDKLIEEIGVSVEYGYLYVNSGKDKILFKKP